MKINPKCLIEQATTTDEERPVLLEPYLDMQEPGKPVMVASCGEIIAVVPVEVSESDMPGPICTKALKKARGMRLARKKLGIVDIQCGEKLLVMEDNSIESRNGRCPEGKNFPKNWRQLLSEPSRGAGKVVRLSIDASLLLRLAKALGSNGVILEMAVTDDRVENPIKVTPTQCNYETPPVPSAVGIIMPMRLRL